MERARRKELRDAYKLAFLPMGIYVIKNKVTGRQLLAQSTNLHAALNRHRLELRLGSHRNPALLADWRLYGEAQFSFDIVEQIEERVEPDFNYTAELEKCMAIWQKKIPPGSPDSYL